MRLHHLPLFLLFAASALPAAINEDVWPWSSSPPMNDYVSAVATRLFPKGQTLPGGITLKVVLLDEAKPEVYSTANCALFISRGSLLAVENEVQLAALLAHELAHLLGAHYPSIYIAFKKQVRRQRSQALAAGLAGVVLD